VLSARSAHAQYIYRLKQNTLVNNSSLHNLTCYVGVKLDYLHEGKNTANPFLS
jgi:hypothetical protein